LGTSERVPDRFYQGTGAPRIMHTRIRLKCSGLNTHLYNKNLVEDPACPCGSWMESAKHFLTECPLYVPQRRKMMAILLNLQLPTINSEVLLYGDNRIDEPTNIKIFKTVQTYITETERFTN
jgi:hypothetical protein